MTCAGITPARVQWRDDGVPYAPDFGDVYHAAAGAQAQARHVFLRGNGLPGRWRGAARFVILETGFGLGNNFLATWKAWRDGASRPSRLHYISIEKHPPRLDDLRRAHRDAAEPALDELAAALAGQWPPLVPGVHRLSFDDARVELLLWFADVGDALRQCTAEVDAFYLDGFAPSRNAQMWAAPLFKQLARLARHGATAATWSVARPVRDGLAAHGFDVQAAPGFGTKREMTVARHAPRHRAVFGAPWAVRDGPAREQRVAIVGAGLAGCATAQALAQQGWHCTLIDARADVAAGASGNPAGIFHGVVHRTDGLHARLHRAAALELDRRLQMLPAEHGRSLQWQRGLLRLAPGQTADALRHTAAALQLPPDYVQMLDAAQASAVAGVRLDAPAAWFAGGGALSPAAWCRALIAQAQPACALRLGRAVAALRAPADETGDWQLLDAAGAVIARAPVVVLAHAEAVRRLLRPMPWPVRPQRGQLSSARFEAPLPHVPLAGAGYAVPAADGWLHYGATAIDGDDGDDLRAADDADNLLRLRQLWPDAPLPFAASARAAVRWQSDDRLPLIGALADAAAACDAARGEQPRFVPRTPGLFCFAAPGSRGLAWSAYGARLLASWIAAAPFPLEAALRDALDPARWHARARRTASRNVSRTSHTD